MLKQYEGCRRPEYVNIVHEFADTTGLLTPEIIDREYRDSSSSLAVVKKSGTFWLATIGPIDSYSWSRLVYMADHEGQGGPIKSYSSFAWEDVKDDTVAAVNMGGRSSIGSPWYFICC